MSVFIEAKSWRNNLAVEVAFYIQRNKTVTKYKII